MFLWAPNFPKKRGGGIIAIYTGINDALVYVFDKVQPSSKPIKLRDDKAAHRVRAREQETTKLHNPISTTDEPTTKFSEKPGVLIKTMTDYKIVDIAHLEKEIRRKFGKTILIWTPIHDIPLREGTKSVSEKFKVKHFIGP